MSDLEFFSPGEGGESYDPAAFERFKEQIKKNAAFIAAARKGEQKQKQKEDKLAKILLKFIQTNQKSGILMLAAKLLEENIPPSFILSIIILGNEEIEQELRREAALEMPQLLAPAAPGTADFDPRAADAGQTQTSEFSLITRFSDESVPLVLKVKIDAWGKNIFEAGSAIPFRVLETALDKTGNIKQVVIDCAANVLSDFWETSAPAKAFDYDTFFSFCEFLMKGIMKQLQKQIENQKELN